MPDIPHLHRGAASGRPDRRRGAGALLIMACALAAGLVVLVATNLVTVIGAVDGLQSTRRTAQVSVAPPASAADRAWSSAMCTSILGWKQEIHRDASSLNLAFGPVARIQDAVAATTRMVARLSELGLPPGAQSSQAGADAARLRADVQARLHTLESSAGDVAAGHLDALGTLIAALGHDAGAQAPLVAELHRIVTADLGLSLAETRACRQLVGIPV